MAMFAVKDDYSWFCGVGELPKNLSSDQNDGGNVTGPVGETDPWLARLCTVSAVGTALHAVFLLAFTVLLVILAFCMKTAHSKSPQRCPGNGLRWLLIIFLLFVLSCSIGEGVLSDATRHDASPSQPFLYLPSLSALIATFAAAFYYNSMEKRQRFQMTLLSLPYWSLCVIERAVTLWSLLGLGLGSVQVVRFDLNVCLLAAYSMLIILDLAILLISHRNPSYHPTPTTESTQDDMYYVQDDVSVLSQVTLAWLTKLFRLGNKRPLERKDLGSLPERHTSQENYKQFKEAFRKEKENATKDKRKVSLFRVFGHFCGIRLLAVGSLKLVSVLVKFTTPAAIRGIVLYASAHKYQDESVVEEQHFITVSEFFSNGYILLFILFVAKVTHVLCIRSVQYYLTVQAIHTRIAIQGMVYDKSLRLSLGGGSNGGNTAGKLINFMSIDPANLQQMFREFHSILATVLSITITMVLLYLLLGFSALIGAASLFLVMPLTALAGRGMSKFQKKALLFSDSRLKYSKELVQAIKLVKMYGWEDVFCHTVESVRKQELLANLVRSICFALTTTIASAGPILITLVSFGTYTLLSGQALTPEVALPALSLFYLFESSLFYFPFYISYMVTGVISTHRLQAFLMSTEVEGPAGTSRQTCRDATHDDLEVKFKPLGGSPASGGTPLGTNERSESNSGAVNGNGLQLEVLGRNGNGGISTEHLQSGVAVKIKHGTFSWDSESDAVLHDISVNIPSGKLTVIIGSVGSGKSSLLSAMLGEMTTLSGHINLQDSDVAYTAQTPWIMNASVRDNITLDCNMDDVRYQEVIAACALQPDLEQFPAGDRTEIGEKGINISGGQKQRISLARALYSNKTTVIMDDPLSALDAHVCRHIVQQGIAGLLSKNGRTAILVTNQLHLMKLADHVLVMINGRVELQGTQQEIGAEDFHTSPSWSQLLQPITNHQDQVDDLERSSKDEPPLADQSSDITNGKKPDTSSQQDKHEPSGQLVKDEERKYGSVSHRVYLYLIRVIGWPLLAWIVALFVFNGCLIGKAFKLAEWSEAGIADTNTTVPAQTSYYIMGYTAWSAGCVTAVIISDVARTSAAYFATRNLFQKLLNNVIHLPLRFFDTTPTGRILNRFSSDTNSIDQYLFQNLDAVLFNAIEGLFFIILDSIVAPAYLIAIIPLAIIHFLIVRFFLASSREIKRMESISRSPVLAYFTQTLDGLPTIRAYGYQKHFLASLLSKVNENCTAYLYLQTSNLWLNIWLDILGTCMVLAAGVAALLASSFDGVSASLVGLAIAIAVKNSSVIGYLAKFCGELEIRMNAVERIEHYTCLPTEKYQGIEPASDWPSSGGIEFNQLSARYDITLQPVLNKIDLRIEPGKKIGICGRTGSGKSSLTLALLQLIDTHEGSLIIDGLDVSHVSLSALRQQMSIIPQDPVLFTGTIRKNLDPTGKMADGDLWEALQIAQVKGLVSDLGGLDFQVSEGGENFSVGQRQLFCLARAFLRKSRILIMDEATASVDLEMDKTLQQVVVEAFKDRTVLIVAHRVETIMNCDTILVMSNGEITEMGTPEQLLATPEGEFAALVQARAGMARSHDS
ncbi:ATP-binding cassette sub-family C member 9-like isoform X2 [Patiria miniata]|uniref:Uncharacterized protein n=1 Tax=Patiria miniata TaxID=46514 RepID=A0A914B986_PATMI|nr:ATP-binding cassette sub-family C member 9-like isoform X2 [Patiria miniata]